MSDFWNKVGDELRYRGMNMKELASEAGVPYTTISNGMSRGGTPAADTAARVAAVLRRPVEYFLGDDARPAHPAPMETKEDVREQEKSLLLRYRPLMSSLENMPSDVRIPLCALVEGVAKMSDALRASGMRYSISDKDG